MSSVYFHPHVVPLLIPIEDVRPYESNPNNGDVDVVIDSIVTNGFYLPIVVQAGTGVIIAGHTRHEALLSLGETQIPAIHLATDNVASSRIRLADNRTNRLGKDDSSLLIGELEALLRDGDDLELRGTGYQDRDLEMLRAMLEEPLDFEEEEFAKQRSGHICECPACGWTSDKR